MLPSARSRQRTETITSFSSPPYAPAFISTPPPTEPGMPEANSSPVRECSCAKAARRESGRPAETQRSPSGRMLTDCIAPVESTKRSSAPSSGKTTFVPFPSKYGVISCSRKNAQRLTSEASSGGTASTRTGPPDLNEQWCFIGSFSRRGMEGKVCFISSIILYGIMVTSSTVASDGPPSPQGEGIIRIFITDRRLRRRVPQRGFRLRCSPFSSGGCSWRPAP